MRAKMSSLIKAAITPRPSFAPLRSVVVQRKCACGEKSGASGECEECKKKRLLRSPLLLQPKLAISQPGDAFEQEADRIAERVMRGPDANTVAGTLPRGETLQRASISALDLSGPEEAEEEKRKTGGEETAMAKAMPGQCPACPSNFETELQRLRGGDSLSAAARAFFEPRFGHDFGQVRVHAGAAAAHLAEAVRARAFTLGCDIVFGRGQYAPGSPAGLKLLAHELTHVVQQRGASLAIHRKPEEKKESPLPAPSPAPSPAPKPAPATPFVCDPDRALTWPDFKGTPDPKSTFAAWTASDVVTVTSETTKMFQGKFEPAASWVKAQWKDPTDRKASGCENTIKKCEEYLAKNPSNYWHFLGTPDPKCPASPVGDPSIKATTKEECTSKIGKECDRVADEESRRLLRHEQLHFDISCTLAKKANAAVAGGRSFADVETAVNTKKGGVQSDYDTQSNHGCKAAEQATWTSEVGKGLPKVTIP